jgi:hypothetical protein
MKRLKFVRESTCTVAEGFKTRVTLPQIKFTTGYGGEEFKGWMRAVGLPLPPKPVARSRLRFLGNLCLSPDIGSVFQFKACATIG